MLLCFAHRLKLCGAARREVDGKRGRPAVKTQKIG
jgi:hypothetical protein